MRTLGIDLGTRRVGLSLSDEGGKLATPYDVVEVSSPGEATARVLKVIREEGVRRIVVGLPINMDDSMGPAATTAARWAAELSAAAGLPMLLVDERLSSFEAEQHLSDRKRGGEKLTKKRKKARLDAIAATGFLQAFLDGRLPSIPAESVR